MGMYTELNVSMNLKLDENTLEVLRVMVGEREMGADIKLPDAPLFRADVQLWRFMFMCYSFYFDHTASSSLVNRMSWADEDSTERVLNVRCDLKNYNDEIENFLDWIYQYSETRGIYRVYAVRRGRRPYAHILHGQWRRIQGGRLI